MCLECAARLVDHVADEPADLLGVVADVSSGQVTFMFDQITAALPLVQAGKLKLLAVTTAKRMALAPQLPTMAEAGVPGFEMASWQAVYAPKDLPKPIAQRLSTEIAKILQMPDIKQRIADISSEPGGIPSEQFADLIKKESVKWAKVVKDSGAKAD